MKKVISLLLALVMTLSLCSGVWATDTGQEDEDDTQKWGAVENLRKK